MSLFDPILQQLERFLQPVLTPLTKLWNILKGFFTALVALVPATTTLVKLVYSEIQAWKTFREGINFKTGVINLQSARDRIEQLITEILQGWNSLVDLFTAGFKRPFTEPLKQAEEAVNELADLFGGLEKLGLKGLQDIGPKLEKLGGKVFEVLAIIQVIAEDLLQVVNELTDIVTAVKDVRETFETGEGLFLSQKNKRRTLQLADGSSIKIRVGNLHS